MPAARICDGSSLNDLIGAGEKSGWNGKRERLFVAIVLIVFGAIDESLYPGPLEMGPFSYVTMVVVLALILPTLAVSVRRLHDIDRTGWWVLIGATFIGTLVLIYWACLPGTSGSNRFG
jgi:uncharacterized membrane protein YhaH (DUF805 family)